MGCSTPVLLYVFRDLLWNEEDLHDKVMYNRLVTDDSSASRSDYTGLVKRKTTADLAGTPATVTSTLHV